MTANPKPAVRAMLGLDQGPVRIVQKKNRSNSAHLIASTRAECPLPVA
ncbi:hypothetical protein H4W34_006261 [Actinomadura algeriensis]|uniref:Transposase n=1 Tax=Actinomadura algeriensis TaxID=1679523 RepID=A0ABR9K133_9ACTN|nr:hypothetical protein [Actinomadura algeriensis]